MFVMLEVFKALEMLYVKVTHLDISRRRGNDNIKIYTNIQFVDSSSTICDH